MGYALRLGMAATCLKVRERDCLRSFRNFASFDTACADLHALNASLRALHANGLQVWIKATGSAIVRMRNIVAELRAFAADFASFCHFFIASEYRIKRVVLFS